MRFLSGYSFRIWRNEQGIALVSALVLGVLGMLMVATLLLMVQTGTWISGSKKRYQMALDAAHGGMHFFAREVINRGLSGTNLSTMGNYGGLLTPVISDANLVQKLTTSGRVGVGAYPNIPLDATISFALPSGPNITVNTTILSSGRGNSGTSTNILEGGGVVDNSGGKVTPLHIPYLYQIEIQAQGTANENARLSALYAY